MTDRNSSLYRILDAAANRAREGLRVLEDYARFGLNDKHIAILLKKARHTISGTLEDIAAETLVKSRDTLGDVGTELSTSQEFARENDNTLLTANLKRAQEAVRSLEEYSKRLECEAAKSFEQLRYQLYTIEKALITTISSQQRLAMRPLYCLLTRSQCRDTSDDALQKIVHSGIDILQIREKQMPDRELLECAIQLRYWTREADVLLIMNDRPDLALLCQADGVHVGQEELPVSPIRQILGPDMLIGVSTHNIEQARQAVLDGADYIGVGPVFPSKTKSFSECVGTEFVEEVADEITLPAYAIGGIDTDNVAQIASAGGKHIAVGHAILNATDAAAVAHRLKQTLSTC